MGAGSVCDLRPFAQAAVCRRCRGLLRILGPGNPVWSFRLARQHPEPRRQFEPWCSTHRLSYDLPFMSVVCSCRRQCQCRRRPFNRGSGTVICLVDSGTLAGCILIFKCWRTCTWFRFWRLKRYGRSPLELRFPRTGVEDRYGTIPTQVRELNNGLPVIITVWALVGGVIFSLRV